MALLKTFRSVSTQSTRDTETVSTVQGKLSLAEMCTSSLQVAQHLDPIALQKAGLAVIMQRDHGGLTYPTQYLFEWGCVVYSVLDSLLSESRVRRLRQDAFRVATDALPDHEAVLAASRQFKACVMGVDATITGEVADAFLDDIATRLARVARMCALRRVNRAIAHADRVRLRDRAELRSEHRAMRVQTLSTLAAMQVHVTFACSCSGFAH